MMAGMHQDVFEGVTRENFWYLTEHNAEKGETWTFFLELQGNCFAISLLESYLSEGIDGYFAGYVRVDRASIEAINETYGHYPSFTFLEGSLSISAIKQAIDKSHETGEDFLECGGLLRLSPN